jgi:hypothetical protein
MSVKQLAGKLTISRVRSNRNDGYVQITIEDSTSGCVALRAEVPLVGFAEALMACGYRDCEFWLNESGVVGKDRECRKIIIPAPNSGGHLEDEAADKAGEKWIRKHAAKELVDGWEPNNPGEVFNRHRRIEGTKNIHVGLVRFVERKEGA